MYKLFNYMRWDPSLDVKNSSLQIHITNFPCPIIKFQKTVFYQYMNMYFWGVAGQLPE